MGSETRSTRDPRSPLALVVEGDADDLHLAERTLRALRRSGVEALSWRTGAGAPPDPVEVGARPVWLLRAGAWPACRRPGSFPAASATGLPLAALGAPRLPPPLELDLASTPVGLAGLSPATPHGAPLTASSDPLQEEMAAHWRRALSSTGGDLGASHEIVELPLVSLYCEAPIARRVLARAAAGEELFAAARTELLAPRQRLVHCDSLDVFLDDAVRVAQIVTSLQIGGAERLACGLAREFARRGAASVLIVLGRAARAALAAPPGAVDVSALPGSARRLEAALAAAQDFAADVLHLHLVSGEGMALLARGGIPLVATVHNQRQGWPAGLESLAPDAVSLLIACSRAVEEELRAFGPAGAGSAGNIPARTALNGIDRRAFTPTAALTGAGAALRQAWGIAPHDVLFAAVANPRPQKRLDLLAAVLEQAQGALAKEGRRACLVLAGDVRPASLEGAKALRDWRREVRRRRLVPMVKEVGLLEDVRPLLAASDCLLSTSAHEGLSLALLEALAMGLPAVVSDAGGAREVASVSSACAVLPSEAPAEAFAREALRLTRGSGAGRRQGGGAVDRAAPPPEGVDPRFDLASTARRYLWLYPRAAARAARSRRGTGAGDGVLLVANNFSTGGAQSSARRLLLGLRERGVAARAAVLQEDRDWPTPGRRALEAAGVPVLPLPPPPVKAAVAVAELLRAIDRRPPRAVILWNALAEHKVLIADALLGTPIFDVSPGEMFHRSLEALLESRRPELPVRAASDYGALLRGAVVKYAGERREAEESLRCPVRVIPNGVPMPRGLVDRRPAGNGSPLVLGTMARLSPQKRLEELLAALALAAPRLPPHVLRIAGGHERGDEAYAEGLRAAARPLRVEFTGGLEEVGPFLDSLDLFVSISEPAGCPNAPLEAMARGLPVIATDWGGAREQVTDGLQGRLVPRGDVRAIAEALVELARDPARRSAMGRAAREEVERRFSLERMVSSYLALLE